MTSTEDSVSVTHEKLHTVLLGLSDQFDEDEGPVIIAWSVERLAQRLFELLSVADATGSEPLGWHHGPTESDLDPGKRWHNCCGGEILYLDGDVCLKCDAKRDVKVVVDGEEVTDEPTLDAVIYSLGLENQRLHEALDKALAGQSDIPVADNENACTKCNRNNPVWFAPSGLWNRVMGNHVGFLCPICFIEKAEAAGIRPTGWMLTEERL